MLPGIDPERVVACRRLAKPQAEYKRQNKTEGHPPFVRRPEAGVKPSAWPGA
jgi:hypothetical protein